MMSLIMARLHDPVIEVCSPILTQILRRSAPIQAIQHYSTLYYLYTPHTPPLISHLMCNHQAMHSAHTAAEQA